MSARRSGSWSTRAGQSLFGTFGNPMTTDPSAMGKDSGVANTNIVWHAGKLMALEEAHKPFELDPATLDSRGYSDDYRGKVTAHPKIDPDTGEMVWFAYGVGECRFTTPSPMASPTRPARSCGATISRRRSRPWSMTSWSPRPTPCSRSCR